MVQRRGCCWGFSRHDRVLFLPRMLDPEHAEGCGLLNKKHVSLEREREREHSQTGLGDEIQINSMNGLSA